MLTFQTFFEISCLQSVRPLLHQALLLAVHKLPGVRLSELIHASEECPTIALNGFLNGQAVRAKQRQNVLGNECLQRV